MATPVQWRRGTTTEVDAFTGLLAEIVVDTDKGTAVVQDGITAGGIPLAKESEITRLDASIASAVVDTITSRNSVQNQEPVSQGTAQRTGFSSTKYLGTSAAQPIASGVDMATGDFGGLVWLKNRDAVSSNALFDTVRGVSSTLYSDSTGVEDITSRVTSFDSTGFSVSSDAIVNTSGDDYISWNFQTTKKTTGVTNRGKSYTSHYNPSLGFSIVGYEGDGVVGHEIPHHLGKAPDLSIFKNRDSAQDWIVQSPLFARDEYLRLNTADSLAISNGLETDFLKSTLALDLGVTYNSNASDIISYHFSNVPGVCKIGKYIGTGAAGNYVDCGFGTKKAGWVLVKNLTTSNDWTIEDTPRGDNTLLPNSSAAEAVSGNQNIDFTEGGFYTTGTGGRVNTLNDEYLFMSFAEDTTDPNRSLTNYDYATTPDTLTIEQDTIISTAGGYDINGEVNYIEEVSPGTTFQVPAGNEDKHLWLYKDRLGSYGVTDVRPLEGWSSRDDADQWGKVSPSDPSLRTTAKHFDYESSTGIVSSSDDDVGVAWNAFKEYNNYWAASTTTISSLQYKQIESRILKSWRFKNHLSARAPRRFTVEGSNDGFNWTSVDSTYTASDYVGNGDNLWGDLQDTSSNTTAYFYYRIAITSNNGDATFTAILEMEFNTIVASDYYLAEPGIMYNNAGTPIERVFLAEFTADSNGDVILPTLKNFSVAKQRFGDVEIHKDLTVRGDIKSKQAVTAWVNFDGTQNPPLIRDSYNVAAIVDLGVGSYQIIFKDYMDSIGYQPLTTSGNWWHTFAPVASRLVQSCKVQSSNTSHILSDDNSISLTIIGGKEIN